MNKCALSPQTRLLFLCLVFLQGLFGLHSLSAESHLPGNDYVRATLVIDHENLQPSATESSRSARIGVYFQIQKGWHIYWKQSGESGMPTKILWELPPGWSVSDFKWPTPIIFKERGDIATVGYKDDVLIYSDLLSPLEIPLDDKRVTIGALINFLVCKDICVPGELRLKNSYSFSTSNSLAPSAYFPLFEMTERLVAKPLEELLHYPALAGVRVEATLNKNKTAVQIFIFNLPGRELDFMSSNIQVFPYDVPAGRAQISTSVNNSYLLSFPTSSPLRSGEGEIVFSEKLSGTVSPLVFRWSLSTPEDKVLSGEDSNQTDILPLRYRVLTEGENGIDGHNAETSLPGKQSFLFALLSAFVAGLLLNFMPCVLPILTIKVLGIFKYCGQSRASVVSQAIWFSLGIITTFFLLAFLVILLRQAGTSLGWGFQFQEPLFVFTLLVVTYFFSFGFFDLIIFRIPHLQEANKGVSKLHPGWKRDFFDGMLVTALSTPCTVPFLGPALAFSFTQTPLATVVIFMTIGIGLSLPYFYLSTHPKLLNVLPKPGPWMNSVKHLMGFSLLGTSVWLLFVLERTTDHVVVWVISLLLVIFFVVWARRHMIEARYSKKLRTLFNVLLLMILVASFAKVIPLIRPIQTTRTSETEIIQWAPYSPEVLETMKKNHTPVFLMFTADWCVTCKVNERLVIETKEISQALKQYGITPVKADWTLGDGAVGNALVGYGAYGVPLYVYIPSDKKKETVVFPTLVTISSLTDVFRKAALEEAD